MGSTTFESSSAPRSTPAKGVGVFRYDGTKYTYLPAVRCLQIEESEGPDPGTARFRYVFQTDDNAPLDAPSKWDEVWPLTARGPANVAAGLVKADDRIAVFEFNDDGSKDLVHHGFAQIPQFDLGPSQQQVTFQSLGAAVRCWDSPLGGALCRTGRDPTVVKDVQTDLPARFNPEGKPNATPAGADGGTGVWTHATFLDPLIVRAPDVRRLWSVAMAAQYILAIGNPQVDPITLAPITPLWIQNPDFAVLSALLDVRTPKPGLPAFNPADAATYDTHPLICQDLDVTGKKWPVALHELLEPHGFGMAFRTEQDSDGKPFQYLEIYRKDDAGDGTLKDFQYQPPESILDPAQTNLGQAHLARDVANLSNEIRLITAPKRYEASFVLAPGFSIAAGDAAGYAAYTKGSSGFASVADKYRLFVFDETGEGHWDFTTSALVTTIPSLDDVLGPPDFAVPSYVNRRRPPIAELFSKPSGSKEPYRAELWASINYTGPSPGVYDPEEDGDWQQVHSGWSLLHDRLGIMITVANPEMDFNIGISKDTSCPFPSGKIKLVTSLAVPDATNAAPKVVFRLTCGIEGDKGLGTVALKRPASPTKYTVAHVDECRDRFRYDTIQPSSQFSPAIGVTVDSRDDRQTAQNFADARRLANELGPTAGSFTVPKLTLAYRVGDRVRSVVGRDPDVSLATNLSRDQGEAPVYPSIVKLTRAYEPKQEVTGQLSDRRGEPPRRRQS